MITRATARFGTHNTHVHTHTWRWKTDRLAPRSLIPVLRSACREMQSPAEHDAPMWSGTPALAGASMREEGAHRISAQQGLRPRFTLDLL